jgi:hypothetical protein
MSAPIGIAPFANHLPVRVRFGEGTALELGGIAASHGARRVLRASGWARTSSATSSR